MIPVERDRRLPTAFVAALLALPIALFYTLVAVLNTGLPTEDDFLGLFGFALRWQSMPDAAHRLLMIVAFQYNEYKMPVPYSLLGLELALTHQVSVPLWIWTGNVLALTMLVPLWLTCAPDARLRERLLYFVPVVWIVMSLGYAETVDFALSGLQVILVVSLSLMSIYLITRDETRLNYLGCLFALLACGTYANAFLLAPIGIPVLLFARRRAAFVAWVASFAIALGGFLYKYRLPPSAPLRPLHAVVFFFTVVGGPFGFHGIYAGALLCGILILVLAIYLALRRADRLQPFAFWAAVWLLLGFALTAYGRSRSYEIWAALSSRYKLYGDLLLAMLYLQLLALWRAGRLPWLRGRVTLPAVIALPVLFGLYSDALGWYRLHARKVDVTYATERYVETHGVASPLVYPVTSPDFVLRPGVELAAREILTQMLAEHLYHLPARFER